MNRTKFFLIIGNSYPLNYFENNNIQKKIAKETPKHKMYSIDDSEPSVVSIFEQKCL